MLVDKDRFTKLIVNIKDLELLISSDKYLPATTKGDPLITMTERLKNEITQLCVSYADVVGLISVEDNITDCITSTDLLYRIGIIKELLTKIRNELMSRPLRGMELLNAIILILDINPCDDEYSEQQICSCGGVMVYEKKYLRCCQCDSIKYNNIDNFNIDVISTSENLSMSSNIVKHFHKNLSYIYGDSLPDRLPKGVADIICDYIRKELPYLYESVHYTYEVHELLQSMPTIIYNSTIYKPKDFKTYTNAFILRAFPEIKIPKLMSEDLLLVKSVFLATTSDYLNHIAQKVEGKVNKYNNNYQFTIHRIIYMLLHDVEDARQLLRFIYIQRPLSFEHKDKKLRKVNERIKCFRHFWDTPTDIYINNCYYEIRK